MQIEYKNRNIQKICTNVSYAEKKYGYRMAQLISLRIDELMASESIDEMIKFKIGRCHQLKGNRKNQYALDLVHPKRLVFEKIDNTINIAYILEIVDYH